MSMSERRNIGSFHQSNRKPAGLQAIAQNHIDQNNTVKAPNSHASLYRDVSVLGGQQQETGMKKEKKEKKI